MQLPPKEDHVTEAATEEELIAVTRAAKEEEEEEEKELHKEQPLLPHDKNVAQE